MTSLWEKSYKQGNPIKLPYFPADLIEKLSIRFDNPFLTKELTLLTTSRCNIHCKYCYNYYTKSHYKMQSEVAIGFIEAYLDQQKRNQVETPLRQIAFTGGEATLNAELIFDVLTYLKEKQLRWLPLLLTNGIMPDRVLERLIEEKVYFQFSFDGGNNPLRRTKAGDLVHDKIVKSIERVVESNLPVVLRATTSMETVSEMKSVVQFAADRGIETVMFAPVHAIGEAADDKNQEPLVDAYVSELFETWQLARSRGIKFIVHETIRYQNKGEFKELPKLVLLPDGYISMTTRYLSFEADGAEKAIIGRYTLDKGIEIYQDKIKDIVRTFLANLDLYCKSCPAGIYCRGRNINVSTFMTSTEEYDENPCFISRGIYKKVAELTARHEL